MSSIVSPRFRGFTGSANTRLERAKQAVAFAGMGLLSLSIVAPVVLIVYFVGSRGLPAISWEFLSQMPREGMKAGGIFPAIAGTLALVLLTMLLSVPVGILGAIYLNEYARRGPLVRAIRLAILNLAGVPSIVHGLFGMGVFVMLVIPALIDVLGVDRGTSSTSCLLAGSATMALLVLPMVITTTEEALKQVPQHQRSASLALGATRWQTIRRIVLPGAMPGILTGLILAIGRAAGETAPILLTGAAFYMSRLPGIKEALFTQFMALPYHLFAVSTQLSGSTDEVKWGTAFVLLALVMGLNMTAIVLRAWLRRGRK